MSTFHRFVVAALPTLALAMMLGAPATAQVVQGGDLVSVDYMNNGVWRVTPAGVVTLIHAGLPLAGPSGVAATLDRELVIADFDSNSIFRMDASGALTFVANVNSPIRVAVDVNGDYLVTSLLLGQLVRVTPSGATSPIQSGFVRPFGIAVEPDGNYLVTEDTSGRLSRVDRATAAVSVLKLGLGLVQGVALFHNGDYATMSGNPDVVYRVPRVSGTTTVLVQTQPLGNPEGIASDFAGGFYLSESGSPNGNRIVHVDSTGLLVVVAQGAPFQNLECMTRVPHQTGPANPTTGAGSTYVLGLEFPGEGGNGYAVVAAFSTYPGLSLPPPDPRGTPLNQDALFVLTLGGDVPPFTSGWSGSLDPFGSASPVFDVSSLPPGALAGTTLHIHAVTINAGAPSGVQSFANPLSLRF